MGKGVIPWCLVYAAALSGIPMVATAQGFVDRASSNAFSSASEPLTPPRGSWLPGTRSYLGLSLGRSRHEVSCATASLLCDRQEGPTQFFAGTMLGNFWGVELGYVDMGRMARAAGDSRAQGLNLSLVGKAQMSRSLNVFGKVGTTYGRSESASLFSSGMTAGSGQGFGLTYGAGLSFDVTPRLSATLEWDSTDMRLPGGGRDPVRSTSLGLQFRY
jgi:OOP family OmpA-OmpF porin